MGGASRRPGARARRRCPPREGRGSRRAPRQPAGGLREDRRQHHRVAVVPAGAGVSVASSGGLERAARDGGVLRHDLGAAGLRGGRVHGQQQLLTGRCRRGAGMEGGRRPVPARSLSRMPGPAGCQLRAAADPPVGRADHVRDQRSDGIHRGPVPPRPRPCDPPGGRRRDDSGDQHDPAPTEVAVLAAGRTVQRRDRRPRREPGAAALELLAADGRAGRSRSGSGRKTGSTRARSALPAPRSTSGRKGSGRDTPCGTSERCASSTAYAAWSPSGTASRAVDRRSAWRARAILICLRLSRTRA